MLPTLLIGALLTVLMISCSSCQAVKVCFGGKAAADATCSKCGGTSCTPTCAPDEADGKLVKSCSLDAQAQRKRAADLRDRVFSKALRVEELPDGHAFVFREEAAFLGELEAIAAFETKCCATLGWKAEASEGEQRLIVTSVNGSAPVTESLSALGWLK